MYAMVAVLSIMLYALGIPLFCFVVLYKNRYSLGDAKTAAKFGVLYEGFCVTYYFGELLEMLRKVGLTSMIMFVAPGSVIQIGIFFVVSALFLLLHLKIQPLYDPHDNKCAAMGLTGIVMTIFCAIMLTMSHCMGSGVDDSVEDLTKSIFVVFLMLVNVLVIFGMAYVAIFDVLWTQIMLLYIAMKIISKHAKSGLGALAMIFKAAAAIDTLSVSRKDLTNDKSASHERARWMREMTQELHLHWAQEARDMDLNKFAQLLACWSASSPFAEVQAQLAVVRDKDKPWMVSRKLFAVWVTAKFGGLEEDISLDALQSIMKKPTDELAEVLYAWKGGQRFSHGKKAELTQCQQSWALQLYTVYSSQTQAKVITPMAVAHLLKVTDLDPKGRGKVVDSKSAWTKADLEEWVAHRYRRHTEVEFVAQMLNACYKAPGLKSWSPSWMQDVVAANQKLGLLKAQGQPVDPLIFEECFTKYSVDGLGVRLGGDEDFSRCTFHLLSTLEVHWSCAVGEEYIKEKLSIVTPKSSYMLSKDGYFEWFMVNFGSKNSFDPALTKLDQSNDLPKKP